MIRAVPLFLIAFAAACWAAATVLTKVALRGLAPLDLLGIELVSSAIAMGCLLGARGRPFLPKRWTSFAALGVLEPGSALASSTSESHGPAPPTAPS